VRIIRKGAKLLPALKKLQILKPKTKREMMPLTQLTITTQPSRSKGMKREHLNLLKFLQAQIDLFLMTSHPNVKMKNE
jgi:hypothetical protein